MHLVKKKDPMAIRCVLKGGRSSSGHGNVLFAQPGIKIKICLVVGIKQQQQTPWSFCVPSQQDTAKTGRPDGTIISIIHKGWESKFLLSLSAPNSLLLVPAAASKFQTRRANTLAGGKKKGSETFLSILCPAGSQFTTGCTAAAVSYSTTHSNVQKFITFVCVLVKVKRLEIWGNIFRRYEKGWDISTLWSRLYRIVSIDDVLRSWWWDVHMQRRPYYIVILSKELNPVQCIIILHSMMWCIYTHAAVGIKTLKCNEIASSSVLVLSSFSPLLSSSYMTPYSYLNVQRIHINIHRDQTSWIFFFFFL